MQPAIVGWTCAGTRGYGAGMRPVAGGARVVLEHVSEEWLRWGIAFEIVLDSGQRVGTPADAHTVRAPRKGLSAVYRDYEGEIADLDDFDATYRTRRRDVEASVLEALPHLAGPMPDHHEPERARADGSDVVDQLVALLRRHGVTADAESIRRLPWSVDIGDDLAAELA